MIPTPTLIMAFVFGFIASYLAFKKRKNPYLWFCVGFFLGIFGILAFFVLPLQQKRRRRTPPAPRKPVPVIQGPSNKFWYYLDPAHTQVGPVSYQAITSFWNKGTISNSTYVWHEEMSEWKKIDELIVLK